MRNRSLKIIGKNVLASTLLFSAGKIALAVPLLTVYEVELHQKDCWQAYSFKSDLDTKYYYCEICDQDRYQACKKSKSIFTYCEIPDDIGKQATLQVHACLNEGELSPATKPCQEVLKTPISPLSCPLEKGEQLRSLRQDEETLHTLATQATLDFVHYFSVPNTCNYSQAYAGIEPLRQSMLAFGPEFLTASFHYLGLEVSSQAREKTYSYLDQALAKNVNKASLQLTGRGNELPAASRPASEYLWEALGSNRWGRWGIQAPLQLTSWTTYYAGQTLRGAATQATAAMFWFASGFEGNPQQLEEMIRFSAARSRERSLELLQRSRIGETAAAAREFMGSLDELLGNAYASYTVAANIREEFNRRSLASSSAQALEELAAAGDARGYQAASLTWAQWLQAKSEAIGRLSSQVADVHSTLSGLKEDERFWQNLDTMISDYRELNRQFVAVHTALVDARLDASLSSSQTNASPAVQELEGEAKALREKLLGKREKIQGVIEGVLEKIDALSGQDEVKFKQLYQAFYQNYLAPFLLNSGTRQVLLLPYEAQKVQGIFASLAAFSETSKASEPRLRVLETSMQELAGIWERASAADPITMREFERAKDQVASLLHDIVVNANSTNIERHHLHELVGALEDGGLVPLRRSREISSALQRATDISHDLVSTFEQRIEAINNALKKGNAAVDGFDRFFQEHGSKLEQVRNQLLDPSFVATLREGRENLLKQIDGLYSQLVLPENLPADASEKRKILNFLAARTKLETLGFLEAPWQAGQAQKLTEIIASIPEEQKQHLNPLVNMLAESETQYFSRVYRLQTDQDYLELFQLRRRIEEQKKQLISLMKESGFDDLRSQVYGVIGLTPENQESKFSRLLDRLLAATEIETIHARLATLSTYFDRANNLSAQGTELINRVFDNPQQIGELEKAILKFVGINFPSSDHESILKLMQARKDEVKKLFANWPPKSVKEGEKFGKEFTALVFGNNWDSLEPSSKTRWKSLAENVSHADGLLRTLYFASWFKPRQSSGEQLYQMVVQKSKDYFMWEGFANEVIEKARIKGIELQSQEVWEHWQKLSPGSLNNKKIQLAGSLAGNVGDQLGKLYLGFLPPEFEAMARGHLQAQLKATAESNALLTSKTLTGRAIDVNKPDDFLDDLLTYRSRVAFRLADPAAENDDQLSPAVRLHYIAKALEQGESQLAAILLANHITISASAGVNEGENTCEPLQRLSQRILEIKKLQGDIFGK